MFKYYLAKLISKTINLKLNEKQYFYIIVLSFNKIV